MKKVLVLGICALFIACSSSPEKTNQADTSSAILADTNSVIVSAVDSTTASELSAPAVSPEVTDNKVVELKAKEAAPEVKVNKTVVKDPVASANEDVKKGEALISKSDCFACHKVNEKLLGPSYVDVAKKYENTKTNVDMLVNKIKAGGSGVWGAIPMSPHPALSDEDARSMVQYILSQK